MHLYLVACLAVVAASVYCAYASNSGNGRTLKSQLSKLIAGNDLTTLETEDAWDQILEGSNEPSVGALLALLRAKGETPIEISGMVRSMKKACKPVTVYDEFIDVDGQHKLLDIVGTGGDGADTINISTAAVILAAACGCKVAKAGNRSVSSRCGSADVLESLGIVIDLSPEQVAECIRSCGVGFMFAPVNHPSMKNVAPIRKSLGVRTTFNILGPITNAAGADRAVIGVFEEHLVDLIGAALKEIGQVEHALVIHGCGLDEISPLGASTIFEIKNIAPAGQPKKYKTKKYRLDPRSIGVARCGLSELRGGDREENAQALIDVLSATPRPLRATTASAGTTDSTTSGAANSACGTAVAGEIAARDSRDNETDTFSPVTPVLILEDRQKRLRAEWEAKQNAVCLNAGAGLYVYGKVRSIAEGFKIARETLRSGKAAEKLQDWIRTTRDIAERAKIAEEAAAAAAAAARKKENKSFLSWLFS